MVYCKGLMGQGWGEGGRTKREESKKKKKAFLVMEGFLFISICAQNVLADVCIGLAEK